MRFLEILHRPSAVIGPLDLAPLRRDWTIWASERGLFVVVDIWCLTVLLRSIVLRVGGRIGRAEKAYRVDLN
jgi:hypothetical protein